MGKYIINIDREDMIVNGHLMIPFEVCVQGNDKKLKINCKLTNDLTPYTEPDLDAIRKEEYYKGFQAGSANTSLVITDNTIRERIEEAYQRGLNNAWDAARKIAKLDTDEQKRLFGCFGIYFVAHEYSASECIEKIRQYEQEKEEQIQVGDEVIPCYTITDPNSAIVTRKWKDNEGQDFVDTIGSNGSTLSFLESHVDKTGRHFPEIAEVLQKMNEDDG